MANARADDEESPESSSPLLTPTVETLMSEGQTATRRQIDLGVCGLSRWPSQRAVIPAANCSINYIILSQTLQLRRISLAVVPEFLEI